MKHFSGTLGLHQRLRKTYEAFPKFGKTRPCFHAATGLVKESSGWTTAEYEKRKPSFSRRLNPDGNLGHVRAIWAAVRTRTLFVRVERSSRRSSVKTQLNSVGNVGLQKKKSPHGSSSAKILYVVLAHLEKTIALDRIPG